MPCEVPEALESLEDLETDKLMDKMDASVFALHTTLSLVFLEIMSSKVLKML